MFAKRKSFQKVNAKFGDKKKISLFKLTDGSRKTFEKKIGTETVSIVEDVLKQSEEDAKNDQRFKKLVDLAKNEGKPIDAEFMSLRKSLERRKDSEHELGTEAKVEEANTKLDIIYKEGNKIKKTRDLFNLCINQDEFLKFRTAYVLIRAELVKKLSNGEITEKEYN
jgi:hypothetical protein